jgi:hypothetical protein
MQPTLKLRWTISASSFKNEPQVHDAWDNRLVLQQWWEEVKTYKPTQITNLANPPHTVTEVFGEWRDIEVQHEKYI